MGFEILTNFIIIIIELQNLIFLLLLFFFSCCSTDKELMHEKLNVQARLSLKNE